MNQSSLADIGSNANIGSIKENATPSFRAFVIGIVFSLFVSIAGPWADCFIKGSALMLTGLPLIAVFLFFVLVICVNAPLHRKRKGLNRAELTVIFIMMMISCAIPTMGLTEQLLPILAGGKYYASEANQWEKLILSRVPNWLYVKDSTAATCFFEGLPKGETIPWRAWTVPLLAWLSFILVLYSVMYSIMVVMRKQWMEKEKLLYPLMHLPKEMLADPKKGYLIPAFFKNRLLLCGITIPIVIGVLNGFHAYYPFIPGINLNSGFKVFRNTTFIYMQVSFPVIGISYLLTNDLLLGLWFFSLLGVAQTGFFNLLGYSIGPREAYCAYSPQVSHQSFGAMMIFAGLALWAARNHLGNVFRKAFKGDRNVKDSHEILSYRTSVFIMVGGLFFMVLWLTRSGLPLHTTIILLISAFVVFFVLTKIIVQGGLLVMKSPLTPQVFTVNALGSTSTGTTGLSAMTGTFAWCADLKVFLMPYIAHSLKLMEGLNIERRYINLAILAAVLVSLGGSLFTVMYLSYRYGGINLNEWYFRGCPSVPFTYIADVINHPTEISWPRWFFTGLGAFIMTVLIFMRNRFLWWPLHPLGFVAGNTLEISQVWFSIFLAWLTKTILLRYGGAKVYTKTKHFFLGLVLGQFLIAGVWLIIDAVTGMQGNVLYLF